MTKLLCALGLLLLTYGVVEAGEKHQPGDTWPKGDGCNTCEMDQYGTSYCTTLYCRDRTDCLHTGSDGTVYNICKLPDLSKVLDILPDYIVEDYSNLVVVCNEDNTKCETPCEKKMKEAMKAVDRYLPYREALTGSTLEYCDDVCTAERALDAAKKQAAAMAKWRAVYQECVQ